MSSLNKRLTWDCIAPNGYLDDDWRHLLTLIELIWYVYILWHRFLSTSVGRMAWYYMYIFCGTGSCPPLWEDWHDIICVYVVAPVLVYLCGKIGMILYVYMLWHRFLSISVGRLAWYYMYILCGTGSCQPLWHRLLSNSVRRLAYCSHVEDTLSYYFTTNKFKHASRY